MLAIKLRHQDLEPVNASPNPTKRTFIESAASVTLGSKRLFAAMAFNVRSGPRADMMTIFAFPSEMPDREQGQTAHDPCLGVSREGEAPLWSQTDRLLGGAGGVANDDFASWDERGGRPLFFLG